jgi:hypothetical protein
VLAVTLLLLIALLEWGLRFFAIQPMGLSDHIHVPTDTPGLVFELVPGTTARGFGRETVTTNAQGFRSPEFVAGKPVIAVIGDSMTFGFGVQDDETNPAVLQEAFPDYQVINAGVSGYNLDQEVAAYERKVAPFNPSLVILEFVVNDADPTAHYNAQGVLTTEDVTPQEEHDRLEAAITAKGTWHIPFKTFLHEKSAIFTFIERRTKGMWFRAQSSVLGPEWTPEMRARYEAGFDRLTQMIGDKPKVFLLWPDRWLHPDTFAWVTQLGRLRGWAVLDVSPLIGIRHQTLGWDHHPSAAVQREVGEALAAFIRDRTLLP